MPEKEVRLIDANEIVKVAEHAYNQWNLAMVGADDTRKVNEVFKKQYLCKVVKAVAENCPTIDPESLRPKGKWELNEDKKWSCSYCGGLATEHPDEPEKWQALTVCCPNCGAKMEE